MNTPTLPLTATAPKSSTTSPEQNNEAAHNTSSRVEIKTRAQQALTSKDIASFSIDLYNCDEFNETTIAHDCKEYLHDLSCLFLRIFYFKNQQLHYSPKNPNTSPLSTSSQQLHRDVVNVVDKIQEADLTQGDREKANPQAHNLLKSYIILDIFDQITNALNSRQTNQPKAKVVDSLINFITHKNTLFLENLRLPYFQATLINALSRLIDHPNITPRKNLPIAIAFLAQDERISQDASDQLWLKFKELISKIWSHKRPEFELEQHLATYYDNTLNSLPNDLEYINPFNHKFLALLENIPFPQSKSKIIQALIKDISPDFEASDDPVGSETAAESQ